MNDTRYDRGGENSVRNDDLEIQMIGLEIQYTEISSALTKS